MLHARPNATSLKPLDLAVPLSTVCSLLLVVALKHFVADFVLQTNWIARGKERATGWALPLAAHVAIHGAMTLAIALVFNPAAWWIAGVDIVIHALVDRGKSMISQAAHWPITDARFWWLLGFDQFLHQVTNVGLVAALLLVI